MEYKIDLSYYKQIRKIGFGGFSTVYLVQDLQTEKLCAAKVLNFQFGKIQNEENTKIFTREVNLLSSIQHAAILHFIGFSQTDFLGAPYPTILTEYSSNGSLRDILIRLNQKLVPQRWNNTSKYIILYGIASGMDFIHQNNIIHRDLKPENVLLDDFFFPKICDFGFSKIFDTNNRSQQSISTTTYNYMAPEMFNSDHYNELVDVYSFGIIMFEIVTEKNAYYEIENGFSIPFKVKNGYRPMYPPNLKINTEIKNLIERCWSQTISDRPNFSTIVKILQRDDIAESMNVNLDDFHFYVNLLDTTKKAFKLNLHDFVTKEFETFISTSKSTTFSLSSSLFPAHKMGILNSSCKKQIKKADEGDDDMMFIVAQSLIDGTNGFQEDVSVGMKYLQRAVDLGNDEAVELYSRLLNEGKKIERNTSLALKMIENPFKNGRPSAKLIRAQIELALEHPDYAFACKVLLDAIGDDSSEAMVQYGKLMMQENGHHRNFSESLKYFKMASEKGDPEGMAFYAYFLRYGFGVVDIDYEEAAKYAKMSCDMKNMTGAAVYSDFLCGGVGVQRDLEGAAYYAKLSCESGNSFGMSNYGCMLLDGIGNLRKNRHLAFKYLKKSADEENLEGLCNFADYLLNYGCQPDAAEIADLYRRSMDKGCPFAYRHFGYLLFEGKGVQMDQELGNKFLKMAADLGDSCAMLQYSRNLWNGSGIDVDKEESLKYLRMGIRYGNKECMASYGKLILESMIPGADPGEGWKYLDMSRSS